MESCFFQTLKCCVYTLVNLLETGFPGARGGMTRFKCQQSLLALIAFFQNIFPQKLLL